MSLPPGFHLGQYEILSALGAGGMGEVYRARDPRLDRDVAIKVLSVSFATDPTALARFEREALSVAKLSHPNVLSIFEFAREGDTAFVVTELVDGMTLRARLEGKALPSRRAVAYALQIAKGIAAAHARGIVHRDLKPENVMITRDDQVKILDFGLAKSFATSESDMTQLTAGMTSAGTIMGTLGYMSPEQVRGLAVDHRSDVFAFGAVLYEMISGVRAFKAETAADTMTAILTKEPPELDPARVAIPPGLDRIVRRCLEKEADLRFQSANDLAFALETLSTGSTSSTVVAAPPISSRERAAWLPWAIAMVALLAVGAMSFMRSVAPESAAQWASFTRISESTGEETSPSLSPDGGTIAYAARVSGSWGLYSQRVGGRNASPIVNDLQRDEGGPAFSPDGSLIAFHESDEDGGIFVAGATGESVRRLSDLGFEPSWSPDGKQIAFTTEEIIDPASRLGDSALYVIDAAGGAMRKVVEGDAAQSSWSPSGERIVYWSTTGGQRDIYTVAAAGGTAVPLTQDPALDWSPVWSPDGGFVYFSSDRGGAMNLWRMAVDQSTGGAKGSPEPVTIGVQASSALPRFSKDGSRLAFRSRVGSINPTVIPFDPATMRAGVPFVLDTQNNIRVPSDVSPDGKQIAYFNIGERQEDIFIGSPDGPMRRVTDDPARDRAPMFTPDGRSLVFYSNRDGNWAAWMVALDGGNLRKVAAPASGVMYPQVSPKGDALIFTAISASLGLFQVPLGSDSGAIPTPFAGATIDGKSFLQTAWSPDGSRIAGALRMDNGRSSGVGVYDIGAKTLTAIATDETPGVKWLADGRRVAYFTKNGSELIVLDVATRARTVVDVRLPGSSTNEIFAIGPDNRTIYYGATRAEADIWILERK
jgi:eukaryotic-like serine/threonine-protein kinase